MTFFLRRDWGIFSPNRSCGMRSAFQLTDEAKSVYTVTRPLACPGSKKV